MKAAYRTFFLLCFLVSGVAHARQNPKDEAFRGVGQARDPATFVVTDARSLNQKVVQTNNVKPLPQNRKRKPKAGGKNGRA